jgi:acyl-CoA thioesterase FadM
MPGLEHLDEYVVVPGDADASNHMNIQRYAEIAEEGALRLADADDDAPSDPSTPRITEITTRQHREQFVGARLEILFGVVARSHESATFHIELRNISDDALAATHLVRVRATARALSTQVIEQPPDGIPRRLTSGPLFMHQSNNLEKLNLELWSDRTVSTAECDEFGWFSAGPTQLAWGPIDAVRPERRWRFNTEGGSFALANVEHRRSIASLPRLGAHLTTIAANVAIERNRRVRREWTFDTASGVVHAAGEFVDVLFDLNARKVADIPASVREALALYLHPALGDSNH